MFVSSAYQTYYFFRNLRSKLAAMKKCLYLLILCIAFTTTANAQELSAEEKKIVQSIQKHLAENLQLLQKIVDINSGTLNVKGVKATGDVLRAEFDKIRFRTEWINMPDSVKRAGHLVASIKGRKGKKLFLIGHLDTVFEPDMPANPYRKINDSTVTGQGVEDMKGGDVIIFAALQALQENGLLNDATITAYFTGDEEKTGSPLKVSRGDFMDRAKEHDVALAFEGAIGSTIATARRGIGGWTLKVYGEQGHSSGIFKNGYGAIYETARILNEFRVQLSQEKHLTFNPGIIVGGTELNYDSSRTSGTVSGKTNIISPSCIVQGDLRFLTYTQRDSARARMLQIVQQNNLAGTRAEIVFTDGLPAMEPTKGNEELAKLLSKISVELGYGPITPGDPSGRGAGDISFISKYVDGLDGLGAEGWGGHAPGETMSLKTFERQIQRAALLIYRLTR
jgi:glutamate carboxypeptidase